MKKHVLTHELVNMIEYLRENLKIEIKTTSEYFGGTDGSGNLYRNCHVLKLVLDDEVISEVDLS